MRRFRNVVLVCLLGAAGVEPIEAAEQEPPPIAWLPEGFGEGARAPGPRVVYFHADWDRAAKELSSVTFRDARVRDALAGFVTLDVDVTEETERALAALRAYEVKGDPTLLVYDAAGNEVARITSFVPPEELLPVLDAARGASPRAGLF